MRDYAKVGPKFWIGETGRALRGHPEAQLVATYLMTSPHANMIGLYYLPMSFMAHETGLPIEGAWKGLRRLIEAQFCDYDEASEVLWVFEMAQYQIGGDLSAADKRCKGVQNEYDGIPENRFLPAFYEKYAAHFHLTAKREYSAPTPIRKQAPSKPLRSQEQEQEQEQEKEQEQEQEQVAPTAVAVRARRKPGDNDRSEKPPAKSGAIWTAYATAYRTRYGELPVENFKVRAQLCLVVDRLGVEEAPAVAAFYVGHNARWYVQTGHSIDGLLKDAEKLRTEWATQRTITDTQARQADKTQAGANVWGPMIDEAERQERAINEQ